MKIGVVLNFLDEEYQLSVFNGIKNRAIKEDLEVICLMLENSPFERGHLVQNFSEKSFFDLDGIILLTSALPYNSQIHSKKDIQNIWGNLPVLSAGQKVSDLPSIYVQTDDSMKQLVEHLILKHNYRNFLFIGGVEKQYDAVLRKKIFVQTMEAYKPWFPELKYIIKNGSFTEDSAVKVMESFYDGGRKKIDAIVCANDNMAIGVHKFFKMRSHKEYVNECAVTGFDDIPQAEFQIPPLTTVRQPLFEIGEKSVEMILKIIREKNKRKNKKIRTERELESVLNLDSRIDSNVRRKQNSISVSVEEELVSESEDFCSYIESSIIFRESCGCKKKNLFESSEDMERKLKSMQFSYMSVENNLRHSSYIIQNLCQTQSVREMNDVLRMNLGALDVKNFCILNFFESENFVKPLFVTRNGKEKESFYDDKIFAFNDFYSDFIDADKSHISALVVKQMYDGMFATGCILFEAAQEILPYLYSVCLAIAQCIVRFNVLEERKKRSEYLELEVAKRTRELVDANEKRLKVEAEVLKISELERQRFSNDLHDDICQQLAGISMLCRSYSSGAVTPKKEELSELAKLIGETLQCTRQYAHNSFPVELESLGLKKSIMNLCNSFELQTGMTFVCDWKLSSSEVPLDKAQKLNIFRIVQEALHNAAKHSNAKKITVAAKRKKNILVFSVCDDGKGFELDKNSSCNGIGMNSMQYRANQIGAEFSIKSSLGKGTCVEVLFPLAIK